MAIIFDRTRTSTVVTCDVCQHWAVLRIREAEAESEAIYHEANVHPGDYDTRNAIQQRRRDRQHAEERTSRS